MNSTANKQSQPLTGVPALVAHLHLEDVQLAVADGGLDQVVAAALIVVGCGGEDIGKKSEPRPFKERQAAVRAAALRVGAATGAWSDLWGSHHKDLLLLQGDCMITAIINP